MSAECATCHAWADDVEANDAGVPTCGWCVTDAIDAEGRWAVEDVSTSLRYCSTFPHWSADDDEAATFTEAEANDARRRMGRNGKNVRVVAAR